MGFPQQTDFIARIRLAEQQRHISEINATGWWRHDPLPTHPSPSRPRRWVGLLLIRAGGWLAGLSTDERLTGSRRTGQVPWPSPLADPRTLPW
jgi:hypothetical protein